MPFPDIILQKIKDEINNDPCNIGYAGKNNNEIADLLNNSVYTNRTIVDASPSPINRILVGIGDSPNMVGPNDVAQAKNL